LLTFSFHVTEKHGTCSASAVQDELQYFSLALDLYSKYNVMITTQNIVNTTEIVNFKIVFPELSLSSSFLKIL
jgi:hypothetical protein